MSFESLDQILRSISPLVAAPEQDPFEQLLILWPDLVGPKAARFSRPTRLFQGILQVATANAVWAQQLTFQRRQLLNRLNSQLDEPLQDIRLSPGYGIKTLKFLKLHPSTNSQTIPVFGVP